MKSMNRQSGFSLISAIFIIVVLASVAGYMFQVSTIQLTTTGQAIGGARAYRAADAGIQWAVRYAVENSGGGSPHAEATDNCNDIRNTSFNVNGYAVSLNCSTYLFSDPQDRSIYKVTATASRGSPGTPDYVSRALRVSFAQPPS